MIDVIDMQNAFYIKWALKLYTQSTQSWAASPLNYLKSVGGEKVFLCDVSSKNFRGYETIKSEFWKEVVTVWLELGGSSKLLRTDGLRLFENPICNNTSIKLKDHSIFIPLINKQGIICFKDFMQDDNSLITFEQFLYKVGGYPNALMDYKIIYKALKKATDGSTEGTSLSQHKKEAKDIWKKSNKEIRKIIRVEPKQEVVGQAFWKRKFDEDILPRYVESILSTGEVKLKEMIFKIFHNIYTTNALLEKMKITESNRCEFCGEVDSIEHALISCMRVRTFWIEVTEWLKKELHVILPDSSKEKLFGLIPVEGTTNKENKMNKANHLLLIAKFSISKAKYYERMNIKEVFEEEVGKRMKYFES